MSTRHSTESRGLRPPPLQTSLDRPFTPANRNRSSTNDRQTQQNPPSNPTPKTPAQEDFPSEAPSNHQRFVLTDPIAFAYLAEDPDTKVLQRRRELQGYESHIVEQWTTSRTHPTFTITTYTGDPSDIVIADVLSVPTDESTWSPRLRVYFKALNQYHARRRETPLGILMVTNLSGFPSSLTVIPVPNGDIKTHRISFFVNEDLKRLNCSGRVGLTLVPPTAATIAKFHQLYRTSDKNEIQHSVLELVKLCQSALMLFDRLEIDYADGLLCDVTEHAINDWWREMGSVYYNIEPHDGILGPTTVSGLLGLFMGARNRLHAVGAPVGKDPFDVEGMKKGISAFQKQQRLPRNRRLDRRTLERLHMTTVKAANHDHYWTVPKAVKSTVAELSGKGGEMVMDVVGRRDRAGIAEIETCDMERFVQLVYGERGKWLWYGKPLKKDRLKESVGVAQRADEVDGKQLTFREENGGFTWTARKSQLDVKGQAQAQTADEDVTTPVDENDDEGEGIKGVLKRTSGFKEAKSGLGRFRGAVGLGHSHKTSKDETPQSPKSPRSPQQPQSPVEESSAGKERRRPLMRRSYSSPTSAPGSPKSPVQEQRLKFAEAVIPEQSIPEYAASYRESMFRGSKESFPPPSYMSNERQAGENGDAGQQVVAPDQASEIETFESSIAESIYNDVDLDATLPTGPETETDVSRLLRRTLSYSQFVSVQLQPHSDDAYPRHLSFSLAEDSVLTWTDIVEEPRPADRDTAVAQLLDEELRAKQATQLRTLITTLSTTTTTFTQSQLQTLDGLLSKLDTATTTLESLYHPHAEHVQNLQGAAEGILRSERERLEEAGKEIETLAAKLEYEVNGLRGRVEDVEAGVGDFEKGVGRVEERVRELEKDAQRAETRGWRCAVS